MDQRAPERSSVENAGTVAEVFRVFLGLGLTSFGGPVAHLGYFREAFVIRRKWISDQAYADLVALCQFLPGPASSQVGMAIGLQRAGYGGLLAAWAAFTLPSAILMVGFAYGASALGAEGGTGWIQGLKAAAVAVVAHAVLGMARSLAPDRERATIAVVGMILAMLIPTAIGQIIVIAVGAAIGLAWLRPGLSDNGKSDVLAVPVGRRMGALFLAIFLALLLLLPVVTAATGDATVKMVDSFYRAGSLVFGGGHVVLPLLQAEVVDTGLVDRQAFLAGYGAAQALPGPLFTFAAYLGAVYVESPNGLLGATIALLAIFLPSALLIMGGVTVLGQVADHAVGAARAARRKRGGGRAPRGRALRSGFHRGRDLADSHGNCSRVFCRVGSLEHSRVGGRHRRGRRRILRPLVRSGGISTARKERRCR